MQTGLLRGRDHTLLGAIATLAEGHAAIALSIGGAPKTYPHHDPNEDACAFAFADGAWLLAVADGHWGCVGAELALGRLLESHAPRWLAPGAVPLADRWKADAPAVALDLNRALVAAGGGTRTVGRTTLSLCVVRPVEGWLAALSVGDSHAFRVTASDARELCPATGRHRTFLGDSRLSRSRVEQGTRATVERCEPGGALVLATDGLSESNIGVADPLEAARDTVAAARAAGAELRAVTAARALTERALEAQRDNQAGDNVATAVLWLEDWKPSR